MTNFDCLPFDVIDYILSSDVITFVDICRLACVSKIFRCISKSNMLWRKKYQQMYPELVALLDAPKEDWKSEFQKRFHYKKMVANKLSELAAESYYLENVSNEAFLCLKDIGREHKYGYHIIVNELERIIDDPNSHGNLTQKYYATKALRYMRHAVLEEVWHEYLTQPPSDMSLVKGACLISQWCQPSVSKCASTVESQIDAIAHEVLLKVQEHFPKHPVIKHGLLISSKGLSQSLWSPTHCKNILICINEVMFQNWKFCSSEIDYYSADTSFIDRVLEKKIGISTTLGIIYGAIAGKLGIHCLSVNFPGHFLLKWLEHPQLTDEREAYTFIDVVENGTFKKYIELQDLVPGYQNFSSSWIAAVPPVKVLIRIAWYLVEFGRQIDGAGDDLSLESNLCNSLELLCLLSPDDTEHKLLLARLFMHLGINVPHAISLLQDIAASNPSSPLVTGIMYQGTLHTLESQKNNRPSVKVKRQLRDQPTEVKFAVGMVMKHLRYNYRCVIYGWDYFCTASTDWIKRMGVYSLDQKDTQPFYNVLVDDGTTRYAAQENLEKDFELTPIQHVKIGRYFESFHGAYYLPNQQTLLEYPNDIDARKKALGETCS